MKYRSYHERDKDRIIEIFKSNCPKYFDMRDERDLIAFLDKYANEDYLVAILEDTIIGCGGHYTKEDMHGIAWTMFEQAAIGHHRLLNIADDFYSKIEGRILAEKKYHPIYINTTQFMERLFSRYGFNTYQVKKDGFGPGLDEYKMKKNLW